MARRHFFPPDHENAFLKEALSPMTWSDRFFGFGFFFAPGVVGIGIPVIVAVVSGRYGGFFWLAVIALVFGFYTIVWSAYFYRLGSGPPPKPDELLAAVPFGNVSSRSEGELVMVEGVVKATSHGAVASELTGKPVLWSKIQLVTYKPGNRGDVIDVMRDREQAVPFTIDDKGTAIEVDAKGAIVRSAPHSTTARLNGAGAPRVRILLDKEDLLVNEDKADASEASIWEGDKIVVLGILQRKGDAYRGGNIVLGSGPHDVLAIFTESRDELLRDFDGRPKPSKTWLVIGGLVSAAGIYCLVHMVLYP